jgi:hypothetical protein
MAYKIKYWHGLKALHLKILSSQKRGGSRGVPTGSPLRRTQSPMFLGTPKGLVPCLNNVKRPVTTCRA